MTGWAELSFGAKLFIAGTTAASIYSTVEQTKATKRAAKREETAAELDATSREIQRTKRLNAYMASVNVQAGAGGVAAGAGSLANLQSVAARENRIGVQSDRANKELRIQGARDYARSAGRQSLAKIVDTGAQASLNTEILRDA